MTIRAGSRELAAVLGDMVIQASAGSNRLSVGILGVYLKFLKRRSRGPIPNRLNP